jgi:hypothetical protein
MERVVHGGGREALATNRTTEAVVNSLLLKIQPQALSNF